MSEDTICKMCGGTLKIDKKLSLYVCEYCGTEFPLPAEEIKRIELARKAEALKLKAEEKAKRKEINKKRMKKALPFIIAFFVVLFTTLIIYANSFRITNLQMSADYDDNYRPIGEIKSYAPNNNRFILTGVVKNAPENAELYFVWKYNEEIILRSENPLNASNKKNSNFYATLPNEEIRPEGKYSVEIYNNDNIKPFKIVYFTVSKNTSDIYFYNLHMTSALKDEVYPVDTVTSYTPLAEQLILTGTIYNVPTDMKITFIWKRNGVKINTHAGTLQYANVDFYRKTIDDYFSSGSYTVEIYINEAKTPSETVNFSVGY